MKNLSLSIIVSAVGEQCHLIHLIVSYRQLYLSLTRDYNTADYLTGQHREPPTFQHLILNHIFCGKAKVCLQSSNVSVLFSTKPRQVWKFSVVEKCESQTELFSN